MKTINMNDLLNNESSVVDSVVADFIQKGWTAIKLDPKSNELCKSGIVESNKFFSQSMDEKQKLKPNNPVGVPGYIYYPGKVDGYFQDDTEMLHIGHFEKNEGGPQNIISFDRRANVWPEDETFKKVFLSLFAFKNQLAESCLKMILKYYKAEDNNILKGLDQGWSVQRTMRYKPFEDPSRIGHIRVGEHRDVSLFTITTPGDANALQIKDEGGNWNTLSLSDDVIVIGGGGILEILTNGNFKNMFHRVIYSKETVENHRVSLPFFSWPKPETLIEPMPEVMRRYNQESRYQSMSCIEYLQQNLMVPFIQEGDSDKISKFNKVA